MNQEDNASVNKLLQELEHHILNFEYGQSPSELYEPISYIMNLGGKRIRPLLTLMAYTLYKGDYEKILTPAMAVEVFHNFTLMHDDIMDDAPLRRGKPTVHEKWNANTAILSGDVMLVKAYAMLLNISPEKLPNCLRLFNQTAAEVCEGQQHDMNFETKEHVSEHAYIEMIRQKTAVLLGFALEFGALLADASDNDAKKLYDFGVNIGIGFQLKDDLLDVYADQAKFGKQIGGDIIANKKTFLLIKAKELAEGENKEKLNYWLNVKDFSKEEKVSAVTSIYNVLGIKELTESKMHDYFMKGFEQYASIKTPNEFAYQNLLNLTQDLVEREK
ncbi:isoprenyl synthetase [Rhodonellum psychrophilum GCM71 = DSM 17998]|uniref:Isoprenyl synthetase n=2 Tax=Rhodonellum TaxID=336827 RepID=U5BT28_9BACT|nr:MULTISPECIES: polyprenyl synthetase family protein [Rhodonellum]ERM81053.1 isoprenyl synthetase [Rhodonellum psychrophilum GCM71 = DSM 17998]MDO9552108.1 polyprenyl synthetase family protein [Rhodonellum sp.]SDZ57165.1 geranylgeranyl diphosphate synthase, type II [Rhodonellum ikkaensis]